MATDFEAVLTQLEQVRKEASASADPEDVLDAIALFQDKEQLFVSSAASDPRTCMDYFCARVELECSPKLILTDDVKNQNTVRLCENFISVFPPLFEAKLLSWLSAQGIYRQACHSLTMLIRADIDRANNSRAFKSIVQRKTSGSVKAYLDSLPPIEEVKLILEEMTFSKKFDHYCNLLIEYWGRINGPSLLSMIHLADDKADEGMTAFVQMICDHRVAKKRG